MKKLADCFLNELETPCVVINMNIVKQNIDSMQRTAKQYNCNLRPHIKTHKSVELAKMQIAAGACGITCAKVSEADVMARGGIDDIFIAYPLVGENKIRRAAQLQKTIKRLILAVDSLECAEGISKIASELDLSFEIRIEVDTGAKRTGIHRKNLLATAQKIMALPGLRITGVYTFKSLLYKNQPTISNENAGIEEGQLMAEIADELRSIGIDIKDISAGSTPTGLTCAKTGLVNEIRPGTYIFFDYMNYLQGSCNYDDIAALIYSTVVSTPDKSYAVLDGGNKTFSSDVILKSPPFHYNGYAYVCENDDLVLDRLSEEHGILRSIKGETGLSVGDIVALIPTHVCTSVNLQNSLYIYEQSYSNSSETIRRINVDARGMVY